MYKFLCGNMISCLGYISSEFLGDSMLHILGTNKIMILLYLFPPRLWDLEKQIKQLRNYRDNYQAFCKWVYDAKRRQDSLESMKFGDSNTVMRFLNEQKV